MTSISSGAESRSPIYWFLVVAVALLSVGFMASTISTAASDTAETNVTVAESTIVTIDPAFYNFTQMTVGTTNFSDADRFNLYIQNDGSTDISRVYVHMDTLDSEQTNPLGTGSPEQYASGGFIWVQNDSSTMYHAGRLEWNITAEAGGRPTSITNAGDNPHSYGYYRNTTGDYLWALNANGSTSNFGPSTGCNVTSGSNDPDLKIKNVVDNGDNRDLSVDSSTYTLSQTKGDWAITDGAVSSGPLDGHYVAAHGSCDKFYIYRFDAGGPFPSPSTVSARSQQYLTNQTIAPGDTFTGGVGASAPFGVPAGNTNTTTLEVHALAN